MKNGGIEVKYLSYAELSDLKRSISKAKKNKLLHNPKPTEDDTCIVCGKPYAHSHEVYYGNTRYDSILMEMQIRLCQEHHLHSKTGIHFDREFDLRIKRQYQAQYETHNSREEFIKIMGQSYL